MFHVIMSSCGLPHSTLPEYTLPAVRARYNFKFRLPAYFSLVVRSLSVLEGIALKRDPNYKVCRAPLMPFLHTCILCDVAGTSLCALALSSDPLHTQSAQRSPFSLN
ncbi:unnamed protein product [Closterium sp. Yama58-4]|nr:unnamed protein product [Closterium sp. Yama58-4]